MREQWGGAKDGAKWNRKFYRHGDLPQLYARRAAAQDDLYRILVEDLKTVAVETAKSVQNVARVVTTSGSNRKSLSRKDRRAVEVLKHPMQFELFQL